MPWGKEEGEGRRADALHSDFVGSDGGRACLATSQREGLIGKKQAQEGSTARDNQGQREDMENKANILQTATNKKKGANVFSLAMVDLSMSQAEVNVVRTHCKKSIFFWG